MSAWWQSNADILQMARANADFALLKVWGSVGVGDAEARLSATIKELLMSAEYVVATAIRRLCCARRHPHV